MFGVLNKIKILLLFLMLSGCATAHKMSLLEIGMTKAQVIEVMGVPHSVSAQKNTEYLKYFLSDTGTKAYYGLETEYYARLVDGKVESFGRMGDFDSTQKPTVKIESNEKITIKSNNKK